MHPVHPLDTSIVQGLQLVKASHLGACTRRRLSASLGRIQPSERSVPLRLGREGGIAGEQCPMVRLAGDGG